VSIPGRPQQTTETTSKPRHEAHPVRNTGKSEDSSFLEAFRGSPTPADDGGTRVLLGNDDLEKHFQSLVNTRERLKTLVQQAMGGTGTFSAPAVRKAMDERKTLGEQYDTDLGVFEKDLAGARKARPADPVPQWLTGELLILIGGEPEEIQPYFRRAVEARLDRPHLRASLARVQIEANQFAQAYDSALAALAKSPRDHYVWRALARAAFALEKFAALIERLEETFPKEPPAWAAKMRRDAIDMEAALQTERRLRGAEQKAGDLPRVRLLIEHRRFARGPGGASPAIESTGKGEVILELFEDQAPNTVASFLHLVETKVYDGTRFYLAEAATLVAGGDPKSRSSDAGADGTGGPGYTIADESQRPRARRHFRGSVGVVNTGPDTAGSQFYITLVPLPDMDGKFTVFGRVIEGQEVIDRITQGRTNPEVGRYGRLIPGDLLVRAEVIRKRPHAYNVVKSGKN
jgi:cyclophilin family peptidyl-prolyl cis-trans isomerase